jgi:hypothetical protein
LKFLFTSVRSGGRPQPGSLDVSKNHASNARFPPPDHASIRRTDNLVCRSKNGVLPTLCAMRCRNCSTSRPAKEARPPVLGEMTEISFRSVAKTQEQIADKETAGLLQLLSSDPDIQRAIDTMPG